MGAAGGVVMVVVMVLVMGRGSWVVRMSGYGVLSIN